MSEPHAPHSLIEAFAEFRQSLESFLPELAGELREPIAFHADYLDRPGAEQLRTLWSITSGQADSTVGVAGGLRLLGPHDSEEAREVWRGLYTSGTGLDAVAHPPWDHSSSLDPDAVRGVYFAAGWIPVLCEPLESNYLAVDLVPLDAGHPGQIVLCGRDEDEKCVVAPDLAHVFRALAAECRAGLWEVCPENRQSGTCRYLERRGGRILTACKERLFPPP